MRDTNREDTRNRQKKRPERDDPGSYSERPLESFTLAQQRTIRKGLRILAKVAVRAHMRKNAALSDTEAGSGESRIDSEERASDV